jgi:plasmid maintenance system antidote protein VapI
MLTTKRKPATVGEILLEEFMQPLGPDPRRAGGGHGRPA